MPGLGIALFVLLVILALIRWGQGFIANVAVLLGIVAGSILATALGVMHFEQVAAASWADIVVPFRFGVPQFHLVPIITMCIVMVVVMIESGRHVPGPRRNDRTPHRPGRADTRPARRRRRHHARRHLQHVPVHLFSQNVGLVGVTGVRSRWVTATGGCIMIALGLLPKMAALVEAVPQVVLGGAGLVMFGMVAATGAAHPDQRRFQNQPLQPVHRRDLDGFGMIPMVAPNFFRRRRTRCIRCWNPASCWPRSFRCC